MNTASSAVFTRHVSERIKCDYSTDTRNHFFHKVEWKRVGTKLVLNFYTCFNGIPKFFYPFLVACLPRYAPRCSIDFYSFRFFYVPCDGVRYSLYTKAYKLCILIITIIISNQSLLSGTLFCPS